MMAVGIDDMRGGGYKADGVAQPGSHTAGCSPGASCVRICANKIGTGVRVSTLLLNIRPVNMRQFASAREFDQLEGLAVAIPWGFESPLPHHPRKGPGQTAQFSSNIRQAILNRSGTGLFVVYNDRRDTTSFTPVETLVRSFVIKFTGLFDL
jgi:hypothetical protein